MLTARLHATADIRLGDEPRPEASSGEELVRVDAVGICGSDVHWFTEGSIGDATLARPLVLGHEMGGTIVGGPRDGERVAVDPSVPCWVCPPCRRGDVNLCVNVVFAGHGSTDGGMREMLTWPADRLHPVPAGVDAVGIAMLEPLGVALHAIDLGRITIGARVGVVGCGPIGLLAVQLALLAGAGEVIAVEPLDYRRKLADTFGAVAVDATGAAELAAANPGDGLDVVIEVAGTDAAVETSIDLCRPGARLVLAGIPEGDRTAFTASPARRKGLTITMSRRMGEVYPRTIPLVASGRIDVHSIVSHRFGLADAASAMRVAAERSAGKVMITPGAETVR